MNFYKISLTKPKIAVAFHAASAYMALIGIADERWKASVARNCRNCFLLLTTDNGIGMSSDVEGRCGIASAFFVGRLAVPEPRLNTMAAQVATSSLPVEFCFVSIGVKQTFPLKIELRSSGRGPAAITHATKGN
ncbi:hypothetical protein [Rhizobium lentis]|uniref:hypothetical protein n=1 Tax=Rhizobium lentis TaxID=1138194 RepID=UPI001FE28728|nr:hypothetical protein [Rhizobium lentis]